MLKIATGAFLLFLISIIALADGGVLPAVSFYKQIPAGDQVIHFFLMGTAALLVNLTLSAATVRVGPLTLLKGSLIIGIITTAEEFSQVFFPGRFFQIEDLLANWLGIFLLGRLSLLLIDRTRTPAPAFDETIDAASLQRSDA